MAVGLNWLVPLCLKVAHVPAIRGLLLCAERAQWTTERVSVTREQCWRATDACAPQGGACTRIWGRFGKAVGGCWGAWAGFQCSAAAARTDQLCRLVACLLDCLRQVREAVEILKPVSVLYFFPSVSHEPTPVSGGTEGVIERRGRVNEVQSASMLSSFLNWMHSQGG